MTSHVFYSSTFFDPVYFILYRPLGIPTSSHVPAIRYRPTYRCPFSLVALQPPVQALQPGNTACYCYANALQPRYHCDLLSQPVPYPVLSLRLICVIPAKPLSICQLSSPSSACTRHLQPVTHYTRLHIRTSIIPTTLTGVCMRQPRPDTTYLTRCRSCYTNGCLHKTTTP